MSYLHFDPQLKNEEQGAIDNTDPKNLKTLIALANDFFKQAMREGLMEKLIIPLRKHLERKRLAAVLSQRKLARESLE
jgi:hypothetical protein